jgi:hypothetical protein
MKERRKIVEGIPFEFIYNNKNYLSVSFIANTVLVDQVVTLKFKKNE